MSVHCDAQRREGWRERERKREGGREGEREGLCILTPTASHLAGSELNVLVE